MSLFFFQPNPCKLLPKVRCKHLPLFPSWFSQSPPAPSSWQGCILLFLTWNAQRAFHRSELTWRALVILYYIFIHFLRARSCNLMLQKFALFLRGAQFYSGKRRECRRRVGGLRMELWVRARRHCCHHIANETAALCYFKHDDRLFAHCLLQHTHKTHTHLTHLKYKTVTFTQTANSRVLSVTHENWRECH